MTSLWLFIFEEWCMFLQKVISQILGKKWFFIGVLKVTDEKGKIRSQSRIRLSEVRIRIDTKMSRIRNTGCRPHQDSVLCVHEWCIPDPTFLALVLDPSFPVRFRIRPFQIFFGSGSDLSDFVFGSDLSGFAPDPTFPDLVLDPTFLALVPDPTFPALIPDPTFPAMVLDPTSGFGCGSDPHWLGLEKNDEIGHRQDSKCAALYDSQLPSHRKLIQWLSGPSSSLPAAWDRPAVTGPGSKKVRTRSSLFS